MSLTFVHNNIVYEIHPRRRSNLIDRALISLLVVDRGDFVGPHIINYVILDYFDKDYTDKTVVKILKDNPFCISKKNHYFYSDAEKIESLFFKVKDKKSLILYLMDRKLISYHGKVVKSPIEKSKEDQYVELFKKFRTEFEEIINQ